MTIDSAFELFGADIAEYCSWESVHNGEVKMNPKSRRRLSCLLGGGGRVRMSEDVGSVK